MSTTLVCHSADPHALLQAGPLLGSCLQWMGAPHIPFSSSLIHHPRASWRSCWLRPVRFLVVIGVAPVGVGRRGG